MQTFTAINMFGAMSALSLPSPRCGGPSTARATRFEFLSLPLDVTDDTLSSADTWLRSLADEAIELVMSDERRENDPDVEYVEEYEDDDSDLPDIRRCCRFSKRWRSASSRLFIDVARVAPAAALVADGPPESEV